MWIELYSDLVSKFNLNNTGWQG